jgi:hypothetical protein
VLIQTGRRRAKTDNIDVAQLLRSLMAYLRGAPKVWSVLRVASGAEESAAPATCQCCKSSGSVFALHRPLISQHSHRPVTPEVVGQVTRSSSNHGLLAWIAAKHLRRKDQSFCMT